MEKSADYVEGRIFEQWQLAGGMVRPLMLRAGEEEVRRVGAAGQWGPWERAVSQ